MGPSKKRKAGELDVAGGLRIDARQSARSAGLVFSANSRENGGGT